MENQKLIVDLVYMWVDGGDPIWQEKKRLYTGKISDSSEQNNIGRYVSNDELKYSLRSAVKHAPWIRKIFIVTDNQVPDWLNVNHPKIQVIDHTEVMPIDILPCYNSSVIEYFLYKIPGLAEHFLLSNDDMFFNTDLTPGFFFDKDGFPIVRLKRKPFGKWHYRVKSLVGKKLGQYTHKVYKGALMVEKQFGVFYSGVPHHNIDAYCKSDYQKAIEEIFSKQVEKSQWNRTRAYGDLHRSAFTYYSLAIGHAHLKYVGRRESSRILIHRHDFMKYLDTYNPTLFCLNDSQRVTDNQREKVIPFLQQLFPDKSEFEK